MSKLRGYYSLVLVTVTGAVVMGLEILGTRVIGTVYGSSLFVWGALITTTLVCLAIGYTIGGLIADRWPMDWLLYLLILLTGIATLGIPAAQGILEPSYRYFGLRWGALVSAFIIFAFPLTLLGMASPFVIRLCTRSIGVIGRTAGVVFALSTAGSVAGTLLTSFHLIPQLGTRWSIIINALALILVSAGGLIISRGKWASITLIATILALPVARSGVPICDEILFRTESPYGRLVVVQKHSSPDQPAYRMLFINGILQTGMPMDIDRRDRTSMLRTQSYYLELLPYFGDDPDKPRKCLLIGLAGGLFTRVMRLYPVDITAVEIDAKVVDIARKFFGYRGKVFIQDGRRFLHSCKERYDFIVLDAYNSDTIPFHLITREMFQSVRKHLTDDGILAINYIGAPDGDTVTDSLTRTLMNVFGNENVIAYRSTDDPKAVQVIYFFAFRGKVSEPTLPIDRWASSSGQVDPLIYELWSRRLNLSPSKGIIITDDHNPIDIARVKTALAWRAQTLQQFGKLMLYRF